MPKSSVVFVLGPPGSGKGTQCSKLSERFQFVHLSAGELLRREVCSSSKFSPLLRECFEKGEMAPAQITCSLLINEIKDEDKVYLIDGFPPDMENLKEWNLISKEKIDLKFVLCFECSELICQQRILARSQTSDREDDNSKLLSRRFEYYKNHSRRVIDQFVKHHKVHYVNADNDIQDVFNDICKNISEEIL